LSAGKYITASCHISNNSVYRNGVLLFSNAGADVSAFLHSVYTYFQINYSRFYKMDGLSKLGWLTSEILLQNLLQKDQYKPEDIGIVLSNTNASLDTDQKYLVSAKDIASPSIFVYTLPNIVTGEICIRNQFKGEGSFFLFEDFDPEFIKTYVSDLLDNDVLQACICGWIELLEDEYKAVLYLVEKKSNSESISFTTDNMLAIFENKSLIK
jgi:hypothetical protein